MRLSPSSSGTGLVCQNYLLGVTDIIKIAANHPDLDLDRPLALTLAVLQLRHKQHLAQTQKQITL